ncbi:GNAT family N-acetyltransferase [Modestobacter sp. VKM Ac-2983]|uniref:GNAT family N-acetyltransferase n=1 Tax=Modestobacter sp. VKM Ac-2983 TaxID=3004137 RepID=UPI0022AB7AED|nr:GNAT family N-acetyltransferase [Modestobacter sp. VKM Ac-2983]MCZ2806719.1 GNAT family N-acetyltransferase [Modestobacter sp. VKM Ac-2983]
MPAAAGGPPAAQPPAGGRGTLLRRTARKLAAGRCRRATAVFLGVHEGEPFGLVQVYAFADEPESLAELSAICEVPAGALSIDYLVGEPGARGRGLGAAMIAAAVARGFADHPEAQDVLVPVARGNVASWRALRRTGATWYAEGELVPDDPVDPPDHVVHRFTR